MIFFFAQFREQFRPTSLEPGSKWLEPKLDALKAFLKLDVEERAQSDVPTLWKEPLDGDVLRSLVQVSRGNCAFCEQRGPALKAYRFRPPAYAQGASDDAEREAYIWRVFLWSNLYPICEGCHPKIPNYFPVNGGRESFTGQPFTDKEGNERASLDASADSAILYAPGEVMRSPRTGFDIAANGALISNSHRADETIAHFHLNRADLMGARFAVLNETALRMRTGLPAVQMDWQEQPLAGTRYLFTSKICRGLNTHLNRSYSSSVRSFQESYNRLSRLPGFKDALETTLTGFFAATPTEVSTSTQSTAPLPKAAPETLSHPRIHQVSIRNYKSLESIDLEMKETLPDRPGKWYPTGHSGELPEAPCLLILGENATGKSSILEAIALAVMTPDMRNALSIEPERIALNPLYMGGKPGAGPRPEATANVTFHGGRTCALTVSTKDKKITATGEGARPLVFAYGAHRLYSNSASPEGSTAPPEAPVISLFDTAHPIANPEPWLRDLWDTNRDALNEVVAALRHIIQIDGRFRDITFERPPGATSKTRRCVINIVRERPGPDGALEDYVVPQRLDIASSGYRAILTLVCNVFRGLLEAAEGDHRAARTAHALVLVDEIEAHLHPRWKMEIIAGLRRALPRTTFILTSHDPLCVRGMMDGEVMMLNRYQTGADRDGDGLPEAVERVQEFGHPIETLTVEQLLVSDLFQLFSTDDRQTDRLFALAADRLAREQHGEPEDTRSPEERDAIARLNHEISGALPYGRNEVTMLVQQAVAEFLQARRSAPKDAVAAAREAAKDRVKDFLGKML